MIQEIQRFNPVDLSDPSKYGFAHITVVPAGSTLVYISGQFGENKNGDPVSNDFTTQLKQSFSNLRSRDSWGGCNSRTGNKN